MTKLKFFTNLSDDLWLFFEIDKELLSTLQSVNKALDRFSKEGLSIPSIELGTVHHPGGMKLFKFNVTGRGKQNSIIEDLEEALETHEGLVETFYKLSGNTPIPRLRNIVGEYNYKFSVTKIAGLYVETYYKSADPFEGVIEASLLTVKEIEQAWIWCEAVNAGTLTDLARFKLLAPKSFYRVINKKLKGERNVKEK